MDYSLKDRTILRIALITSILGLSSLFMIMFFRTEEFVSINDIDAYMDRSVSLQGRIINVSYRNNNTRFILLQECGIEVMVFNKHLNASGHIDGAIVTGKVQEYNGKKSIIADRIVGVR